MADNNEDFGPHPLASPSFDDDERTEAAPHPETPGPLYAEPTPSGPQPRPYVEPVPSGPHRQGPYVDSHDPTQSGPQPPQYTEPTPSGPQPQPYTDAAASGPHQHADMAMPGPYQYGDPALSGPHAGYAEQTPSGPQPQHQHPHHQQPHQQPSYPPVYPQQYLHQAHPRQSTNADELSSAKLLKQTKRRPQSGWRKAVFVASGHLINVGESGADVQRRELITRVNQPLRGCYKIAMLSLKGGVGKTTTTTTLGSTFSSLRGDRVIAVDANPDRGTLSQKIPLETTATVRHLLRDADRILRYSDIRAYTSQGPSRLEVLASEQDPAVSEAYSEDDYRRTVTLLEHFYNIVLTDCGTGLMHSAMRGVLDIADALVVVSSGSVDGARSASATLDWLDVHGYRDLVARSVAVINSVRPRAGSVDLDKLAQHFGARCRAVCRIPFDPHLEEGAEIELDRLGPPTRMALLELAATVADGFPSEFYYMR
ncbi:AAA family ATPase [Actinophytocola sp.]|uniref:MinD/ParA family ATP-binding protein n=1 Tax=Actinophytocola sp. TaxID=1872138 RepID=UPI003D6B2AEF